MPAIIFSALRRLGLASGAKVFMLGPSMIQVSPQIKLNDFERAGRRFSAVRVCLTGMRWVAEYRSADGVVLWKDVPASHGLYAPCVYDPASGVTHAAPGLEWWSGLMGRAAQFAPSRDPAGARRRSPRRRVLP